MVSFVPVFIKKYFIVMAGLDYVSETAAANGPIFHLSVDTGVSMEQRWNDTEKETPTNLMKTCPSATLSITKPAWNNLGENPSLRGRSLRLIRKFVAGFRVFSNNSE
jgi:hypothetical protein